MHGTDWALVAAGEDVYEVKREQVILKTEV